MIDAHCHILPGLDDGARDTDEAVEMARIAAGDGIKQVIATPHIRNNDYSPEDILSRVKQLNRVLVQNDIPLQVHAGAEVSIALNPDALCNYTIHNTPYLLIEFPHDHLPAHAGKLLQWISARGFKPVIAHPERNFSILRSPEMLLRLLSPDIHIQITAGSITGDFGRDVQHCADFLLDSGKVDMVASDAHSKESRPPVLSRAAGIITGRLGEKIARRLTCLNPASILAGEELHLE